MQRRFATVLHLDDYSPAELALIAEKAARERFDLSFAEGLLEDLAAHIVRVHGGVITQHNGGLAINLTEQAFRRLAQRVVRDSLGHSLDATKLVAEDFAIGTDTTESCGAPLADISTTSIPSDQQCPRRAEEGDPRLSLDFAELLESLSIARHAEKLAGEHICSGEDLLLLTKEDCKELGFSIGERNRVSEWAMSVPRAKRHCNGLDGSVETLSDKIGSLETTIRNM